MGRLGASWTLFSCLGGHLGPSWALVETRLGPYWVPLGLSCWSLLGRLEAFVERYQDEIESSFIFEGCLKRNSNFWVTSRALFGGLSGRPEVILGRIRTLLGRLGTSLTIWRPPWAI